MNSMVKIYIVDVERSTYDRLESLFYSKPELGVKVHGYAHNFVSCINDMPRAKDADVFLVSAFLPDQMGIDLVAKIKDKNPNAKVIMMLRSNTRNLAEVAMEKGADTILQEPYKIKDLLDKIEELVGRDLFQEQEEEEYEQPGYTERDTYEGGYEHKPLYDHTPVNSYETEAAEYEDYTLNRATGVFGAGGASVEKQEEKPNEVVAFASTSSAGKTTLLVNVAAAIAEYSDYEPSICILDLNLMYPSVVLKFHGRELIDSKRSIYELSEDIHYLDESLIKQALIIHEPTNIQIMRTPSDIMRDFKILDSASLEQLINHLRNMFDLVLIDTSSSIKDEATMYSLMVADKVVVVTEPDISNLIQTKRFVETLRELEKDFTERIIPKLQFVLNKENKKTGVDTDLAKKVLGATLRVEIPEDPMVTLMANNGGFVFQENCPAAKPMVELADIVYPFDKELYVAGDSRKERKKNGSSLFGGLLDRFKK